jgi:hypothetical protein
LPAPVARGAYADRGHVAPAVADRFAAVGYSQAQALEVVLGVGGYTLSTLLSTVTDAPLDAPFTALAWERLA